MAGLQPRIVLQIRVGRGVNILSDGGYQGKYLIDWWDFCPAAVALDNSPTAGLAVLCGLCAGRDSERWVRDGGRGGVSCVTAAGTD